LSILAKIVDTKKLEVADAKSSVSLAELEARIEQRDKPRGFARALRRGEDDPIRIIAEFKRASPSAGTIRADAEPRTITGEYERAGAAAISILTDEQFFDGKLSFLTEAHEAVSIPLLRKDFLIDPYQVFEARAAGADAVLLIVAALDDALLAELFEATMRLGMDALVEIHNEDEGARALSLGAEVIGVNHRDLTTFEMHMDLTHRLATVVPAGTVLVGESGVKTSADVRQLAADGAHAVLIGETLMRAESPGEALAELIAGCN
jgi:indole-3-glycerol phosphate synthase